MKRNVIISIVVLLVLTIVLVTVFASKHTKDNKNEKILDSLVDVFTNTISDSTGTDIIEEKSVYGKLNGNGNGIQYFGIVLLHKDSVENIDSLISELDAQFEFVGYSAQKDSEISSKYLEHRKLKFDTVVAEETEYISIYFFNSWHPDSDLLDIAGH